MTKRGIPRKWVQRSPRPVEASSDDAKEERLAATRVAVMLGWCSSCGEHVDVPNGKLHDRWCPDAMPAQRAAS